jgi:hypothetical protein
MLLLLLLLQESMPRWDDKEQAWDCQKFHSRNRFPDQFTPPHFNDDASTFPRWHKPTHHFIMLLRVC